MSVTISQSTIDEAKALVDERDREYAAEMAASQEGECEVCRLKRVVTEYKRPGLNEMVKLCLSCSDVAGIFDNGDHYALLLKINSKLDLLAQRISRLEK